MARLPPPVTMITCSIPLAIASSTPYWMVGLSTSGSISFGWALVTGRKRVPRPAAGKIALRTVMFDNLTSVDRYPSQTWVGAPPRASGRRPGSRLAAGERPRQGARQEGEGAEGGCSQPWAPQACPAPGREAHAEEAAQVLTPSAHRVR